MTPELDDFLKVLQRNPGTRFSMSGMQSHAHDQHTQQRQRQQQLAPQAHVQQQAQQHAQHASQLQQRHAQRQSAAAIAQLQQFLQSGVTTQAFFQSQQQQHQMGYLDVAEITDQATCTAQTPFSTNGSTSTGQLPIVPLVPFFYFNLGSEGDVQQMEDALAFQQQQQQGSWPAPSLTPFSMDSNMYNIVTAPHDGHPHATSTSGAAASWALQGMPMAYHAAAGLSVGERSADIGGAMHRASIDGVGTGTGLNLSADANRNGSMAKLRPRRARVSHARNSTSRDDLEYMTNSLNGHDGDGDPGGDANGVEGDQGRACNDKDCNQSVDCDTMVGESPGPLKKRRRTGRVVKASEHDREAAKQLAWTYYRPNVMGRGYKATLTYVLTTTSIRISKQTLVRLVQTHGPWRPPLAIPPMPGPGRPTGAVSRSAEEL